MLIDFQKMTIRNLLPDDAPYHAEIILPRHGPNLPAQRILIKQGGPRFPITIIQPECPERHAVLGRFLDHWSKLEFTLGHLLVTTLRIEHRQLPALANSLGTRGILDVLSSQLTSKLSGVNLEKAEKLLDRVKEKNTRRNYLTHGFWLLEWSIVDQGGHPAALPRVYRVYDPTDPGAAERMKDARNRKERLRYMYTMKRIEALSLSVGTLTAEISAFTHAVFPQPAE